MFDARMEPVGLPLSTSTKLIGRSPDFWLEGAGNRIRVQLMTPQRIQLRRAKGWKMPPNTIKVDRSTRWGNPFLVGTQGPAIKCVYLYALMVGGFHCLSTGAECGKRQDAASAALKAAEADGYAPLRGKNLACWCKVGQPCHGDLLLEIANRRRRRPFDLDAFIARYGYRMEGGEAVKIADGCRSADGSRRVQFQHRRK